MSKLQFSSQPDTLLKQIPADSLEILTVYLELRFPKEVRRLFFIILYSSFFVNKFLTIFYEILYFFTSEMRNLRKNQYIEKILGTSLAILMFNRKNFSDSS